MSAIGGVRATTAMEGVKEFSRSSNRPTAFAAALSSSTNSSASLQIKTKDGDTVSLSLTATQSSTKALASDGSTTVRTEENSRSLEIEVQVEGNLDRKELSDISKLLRKLGKMLGLSGSPKAEGQSAQPVSPKGIAARGNSSLASFSFAYQREESLETASIGIYA